ncbi:hypothetical protein [Halorubrum sp. GN12_10-3_MGM]|uniref:hypothetical protein n=1 Tax=Halorubrum sp. GN12_10-3_MGM TaxID=2518113 RepID=UPI0010F62777|nr:hypothetical protein [Halorubrum sp. GN12_10-3_MGM]TKX64177.1 hypothetical protein EXE47_12415 [Halorubrum sp. GN12_10-3_MGM]
MSEETEIEDEKQTQRQRTASDYLYQTFVGAAKFLVLSLGWIWRWFERRHAFIQTILLLPITVAVGPDVLGLISSSLNFFFGQLVFLGNDAQTRTHPLPLGFSLNVVYILWFLTAVVGFVQIKSLQDRIKKLENK